jgi:hypothetical protein
MKEIASAIMTKFAEMSGTPWPSAAQHNSFYTSVNGQLFQLVAPQGIVYPYATFFFPSVTKDRHFSYVSSGTYKQDYHKIALVQFSLFDGPGMDTTKLDTAYDALIETFDLCTLTITGFTHVFMKEELLHGDIYDENRIIIRHIDFRINAEKNL